MAALSFSEARQTVLAQVSVPATIPTETVWLTEAAGRICATDIPSDRDMPPLPRSLRDGYAVLATDLPGSLPLTGEVKAGQMPTRSLSPGEAWSIMTGAVVPDGATQIVMKEHATRQDDRITTTREPNPGEWISSAGSMARLGEPVLRAGQRLDASAVAMLASVGRTRVSVFRRPVVRILATGDEVVDIARQPNPTQVRNSNSWALAAEVHRFGGIPEILPIAPDQEPVTRDLIAYGLDADLLLISGGVSMGDYDFVEAALANLGATFFFDRVTIQPGGPTVFGQARGTFFFGLPGNPLSTLVTFRVFAEAALTRLAGLPQPELFFYPARLNKPYRQKPGLTRFLPGLATVTANGPEVQVLPWQGSGDIPALVRANCFVVAAADRDSWEPGDAIEVLPK